ncbi:ankyrin repeat domain-containing protein [bacterium]|nr:ankyrin repeat domain-containing protein [bacterium]
MHSSGSPIANFRVNGEPLIVIAARYNSVGIVKLLIDLRADVDARCAHKRTALWHAARNGNINLLRELYSFGADFDEPDLLGVTPFAAACARGCVNVVEYLYKLSPPLVTNQIRLSSGEAWLPLFFSMGYGQRRVSEFLIAKSGHLALTYRDEEGRSALFMAINSGSHDLAQMMMHRLFSLKKHEEARHLLCIPSKSNVTPLWLAALHGDLRCSEWIVDSLRDDFEFSSDDVARHINMADDRGATALFASVQENHIECARLLIETESSGGGSGA